MWDNHQLGTIFDVTGFWAITGSPVVTGLLERKEYKETIKTSIRGDRKIEETRKVFDKG